MDSSHLGLIHQYSTSSNLNVPRPIPTRSQTSPQASEFEFSLPSVSSVRPGLAKIGRRISEMSDNFLYDDTPLEPMSRSMSLSRKGIPRIQEEKAVPFMGDEPVFCPFCEKPLPPGLLSSHGHHEEEAMLTRAPSPMSILAPNSVGMSKATSAPETSTSTDPKPLLTPLPVTQPPSPAVIEPRMTSVELGKPVRIADEVDNAASKVSFDTEELRRWAKVAGIELDLPPPPSTVEPAKVEPTVEAKPFPKLAPPPEDQNRTSSKRSSKFGFFGGKSKDEDDEDSDDDMAGAGGYARLDGPASPEEIEKELAPLEHKERKLVSEPEEEAAPVEPASDEDIRNILKDVLSKVNAMVRSSPRMKLMLVPITYRRSTFA